AKAPVPVPVEGVPVGAEDDDDRLAIIIKKACSRELHDLGLTFNSLNIKVVQSDVAEARRRQSAVEAQANADIVVAQQQRRAKEAQLLAEQAISDKNRDLEQTRAQNAALIADALSQARMVTISNEGGGAAGDTTNQITQVIQTVLAAQLVNGALGQNGTPGNGALPSDRRPAPAEKPAAVDLASLAPRK